MAGGPKSDELIKGLIDWILSFDESDLHELLKGWTLNLVCTGGKTNNLGYWPEPVAMDLGQGQGGVWIFELNYLV